MTSNERLCTSCDAPEAYDGEHEAGDCTQNLRAQRDEARTDAAERDVTLAQRHAEIHDLRSEITVLTVERDEARHLAACRDDELSVIEETVDELRRERDEALRERDEARQVATDVLIEWRAAASNFKGRAIRWKKSYPWLDPEGPEP